tara:strand:- start:5 stop:1195 length:1191 start_codon:yes stop_codon:yes gene_type:complete
MSKFLFLYEDPTNALQVTGSTPHGIYDTDSEFQSDSLTVCKYIARKLGHPVMQLEFNSGSMYACFEEAVSEYSQQINHYNTKNWMWEHYGNSAKESGSQMSSTGSHQAETPVGGMSLFTLAEQYGQAVNVGGNTTMFTGSITITSSQQVYDLPSEASLESSVTDANPMVVQRVFNHAPAAISKFYDPFAGTYDNIELLDSFGFGNVSPAVSYILRPISYDLARANAIETNDLVRKSAYSFELVNNKMRIFPKPTTKDDGDKIYFHYYRRADMTDVTQTKTSSKVSDPSNIPYKFITYSEVNSMGRNWIRKYTLALAKELLGIIRSKYASLPLPNGEVSMDGEALKSEGREEKANLLEELNTFLEAVSKKEQALTEQEVANAQQEVLNKAPLKIYIG